MKDVYDEVDVLVAGGGTSGHIAAIQAASCGIKTSLIEAGSMMGGTMTDGGVFMPNHFFSPKQPAVLGIGWELFKKSKEIEKLPIKDYRKRRPVETPGYYSYINVPVYATVAEQEAVSSGVQIHYHEFVGEVEQQGDYWIVKSFARGIRRITKTKEIIDCTGDADVSRILGLEVEKSEKRQPGTLQYRIEDIDLQQVWPGECQKIYEEALE